MKLITEMVEDVEVITEEKDGKNHFCIEGIFLQGAIKNRNGRLYPEQVLDREVQKYIKEKVETKRAFGELGHPNGPQINLDRVSHLITSLRKEGTNYVGKAVITEGTPYGAIVKGLLESGAQLGVSSRGLGSLKNRNGIMEVQDDFKLATAGDIVADPSAPDAFVNGIMEGVEWVCENGIWKQQQIEDARRRIDAASGKPNKEIFEATAIQLFDEFFSSIR